MTFVDGDTITPPKSLVMLVIMESNCALNPEEADRIAGLLMLGVFQVKHDLPEGASPQGRFESIKSHFLQLVEGDDLLPCFSWAVYMLVLSYIEDFTSDDQTAVPASSILQTEPFLKVSQAQSGTS